MLPAAVLQGTRTQKRQQWEPHLRGIWQGLGGNQGTEMESHSTELDALNLKYSLFYLCPPKLVANVPTGN